MYFRHFALAKCLFIWFIINSVQTFLILYILYIVLIIENLFCGLIHNMCYVYLIENTHFPGFPCCKLNLWENIMGKEEIRLNLINYLLSSLLQSCKNYFRNSINRLAHSFLQLFSTFLFTNKLLLSKFS